MNIQFLLEKLYSSEQFEKFKKENPNSYACSGFLVFDFKGEDKKYHFDFFDPDTGKIYSFQLEQGIQIVPLESLEEDKDKRNKLLLNYDLDFDEVKEKIEIKMKEEKIDKKIEKILISLQNLEGKDFLICTVFISGLGLLKVNYDISEDKITDFEKKSFFDFIKRG